MSDAMMKYIAETIQTVVALGFLAFLCYLSSKEGDSK